MISLISYPNRVLEGETVKIEFNIGGKNKSNFYGKYINLNIKKNGTNSINSLYPQRYNNEPLIWEINEITYFSYGTFNVNAIIQNIGTTIATTSFIIDAKCIVDKINVCNNLSDYKNKKEMRDIYRKEHDLIDNKIYTNIQKPNEKIIELKKESNLDKINNDYLSNKVQKSSNNVNPKF